MKILKKPAKSAREKKKKKKKKLFLKFSSQIEQIKIKNPRQSASPAQTVGLKK
ncbi:hypothetical protein [Flavobacterium sp. CSZ]|uniref:hypothetical protein n=1 Tax=Flavobacterium sp. CSZ TaxID=2783791 RepID=UPI00188B25DA|nr:hypothetical protein [Flavobacterium sp. CSZ]MBF4483755.1 hypothetical protein [Flavobacterium sp. CSZ]